MKSASKGHIAILFVNIIFGLNIPIAKSVLFDSSIDPIALTYFRMLGATFVFWIASLFIKRERVSGKDILFLVVASFLGIAVNQTSFVVGLNTTSPIDASLIVTLTPIITMLISAAYLKEPITYKKVIGVLVGCAGAVILILSSRHGAFSVTYRSWLGNALCLLSSLAYASYLVFFRDFIKTKHPITLMKYMFLFSLIMLTPLCYNNVLATDFANISPILYGKIIYVILMATFLTYLLIPIGQKNLRPTTLTMYNYLQPIIASIVAIVAGQDMFGWEKAVSCVLVFLGVYIVTHSKSRDQLEREKQSSK
ncbi:MAG: DMT family transporter [Bacteroidales bacterium]|jgi:drug/metabolite transporter (DMT)-like permease|nr:DMT family transporter [Bacteroidales bacterium]